MLVGARREISNYYRETTGSGQLTPFLRLVAGAGAGIVAMSATYPLDMVRGRLTVQEGKQYRGILHAAQVITREVRAPHGTDAGHGSVDKTLQ
jgi:solute carrier family 25 phosphate transporter 23/24/25/41